MGIRAFSKRSTDVFYSLTFIVAALVSAMAAIDEVNYASNAQVADKHVFAAVVVGHAFLIFILGRIYLVIHDIDDRHDSFANLIDNLEQSTLASICERFIRLLLLCSTVLVVKPAFGVDHAARDFAFILRDLEWMIDFRWMINSDAGSLFVGRDFWRSTVYAGTIIFFVACLFIIWDINAVAALSFNSDGVAARREYCRSIQLPITAVSVQRYEESRRGSLASMALHDCCFVMGFMEYLLSFKFLDRMLLFLSATGLCLLPMLPLEALVAILILLCLSAVISWRSINRPLAAYLGIILAAPLFVFERSTFSTTLRCFGQGIRGLAVPPLAKCLNGLDRVRFPRVPCWAAVARWWGRIKRR